MSPYGAYEISGLVFAARTLFGFTLGALLGLLIRRTVPAMAATAAVWVAVVVPSIVWLRPLIQKPITGIGDPAKGITQGHHVPFNATVVNHWFQDSSGHHVGFDQLFQQASVGNGGIPPSPDQFNALSGPASVQRMGLVPARTGGSGTSRPSRPPATPSSPSCWPSPPCWWCGAERSDRAQVRA